MAAYEQYGLSGTGLCIIMANFVGEDRDTSHLEGYMHDIEALKSLFGDILNFTVMTKVNDLTLINLSRQELEARLSDLQTFLKKEWKDKGYDRLYVFLLSHGGQKGLYMCKKDTEGSIKEKDSSGNLVYMSVEEIMNHFTQKSVPALEDVPKCFFIQACRGSSYMQVAADGLNEMTDDNEARNQNEEDSALIDSDRCLTITGADIFVAYSTHEHTKCFVNNNEGSIFISETVKAIKKGYKTSDIFEIMTEVINCISCLKQSMYFPCNNSMHEIRVFHKGNWCPFTVCGKVKGSESDFELPIVVKNTSEDSSTYTGFISHNNLKLDLDKHCLSGWVYLKKGKHKCCELESLSSEQLMAFHDTKYFLVEGEVRNKDNRELLAKGTISFADGKAEGAIIKINDGDKKDLDLCVEIQEDQYTLERHDISYIKDKPAKLYIDKQLYGHDAIELDLAKHHKSDTGVCGVEIDVYQLPLITSTLRKKLFIVPPEKTVVSREVI